jgi:ParB family chromosome partitioning protein
VLVDKYGYTHEAMAEKLGKSRTTITESLSLAAMPEDIRQLCRRADIQSKSMLLQVVRQGDHEKMVALVERLKQGGSRDDARRLAQKAEARRGRGRPATTSSSTSRGVGRSRSLCSSSAPTSRAKK